MALWQQPRATQGVTDEKAAKVGMKLFCFEILLATPISRYLAGSNSIKDQMACIYIPRGKVNKFKRLFG